MIACSIIANIAGFAVVVLSLAKASKELAFSLAIIACLSTLASILAFPVSNYATFGTMISAMCRYWITTLILIVMPVLLAVTSIVLLYCRSFYKTDAMREGCDLPVNDYGLSDLKPENVPENLRDLLPLAVTWGIGDDGIRYDFTEKASVNEKQALQNALTGRLSEITMWLDSFEVNKPMSDEAACFMYMQLALDEMGLWPDT